MDKITDVFFLCNVAAVTVPICHVFMCRIAMSDVHETCARVCINGHKRSIFLTNFSFP